MGEKTGAGKEDIGMCRCRCKGPWTKEVSEKEAEDVGRERTSRKVGGCS